MAEKDSYVCTRHTRQLPFTYVYIIFELHLILKQLTIIIWYYYYVSIHALTIQKHIK